MLLPASAASPSPAIQIAPSFPFGVTFNTLICASVCSLYVMIQPV